MNQEECRDTIFKRLVDSNSMPKEMWKSLKPFRPKPDATYGLCKVHKQQLDGCIPLPSQPHPPFWLILSPLQTHTYNLATFLVPMLNLLTKNDFTVKDSLQFTEEISEQDLTLSMDSLGVDSLYVNISLIKTILIFASISYLKALTLLKVLQSQNLNNYYIWLRRCPI